MNAGLTTAEIAAALGAVGYPRRSARGPTWRVRCPAHDDRNPSLDITDANGITLFRCRAECTQREILDALVPRGLWAAASGRTAPRARLPVIRWEDHLQRNAPPPPPCCLQGPENGAPTCEHWRAFDSDMAIARLHANLSEAAAEVVELFQTARYELNTVELRDELKLAVELGGSAIVPWHMTADIVEKMIDVVVAEVLADAARAA